MIQGYISGQGSSRRPYIDATFRFPERTEQSLEVALVVDTGADRTTLSPLAGIVLQKELGIDLNSLPEGKPSRGVGGRASTRSIQAMVSHSDFSTHLKLNILEAKSADDLLIPSFLGRDVISQFALYLEDLSNAVHL